MTSPFIFPVALEPVCHALSQDACPVWNEGQAEAREEHVAGFSGVQTGGRRSSEF